MPDFWEKYTKASNSEDAMTKLELLCECFAQKEDKLTRRLAAHDLGYMFYVGRGVPVNKERGKRLMKVSADLGHPAAMNLYGQMLTHDGDPESITYFFKALDKAHFIAAKNLNRLLISSQEARNTKLCNRIEAGVAEVVRLNLDKGEDREAYMTLALVGLYGLGQKCGISVAQGEEYLQKAIEAGHPYAERINRDSSLKYPQALPHKTTNEKKPTEKKRPIGPPPFTLGDVIVSMVVGAIASLFVALAFRTGFVISFLAVTFLTGLFRFAASKH